MLYFYVNRLSNLQYILCGHLEKLFFGQVSIVEQTRTICSRTKISSLCFIFFDDRISILQYILCGHWEKLFFGQVTIGEHPKTLLQEILFLNSHKEQTFIGHEHIITEVLYKQTWGQSWIVQRTSFRFLKRDTAVYLMHHVRPSGVFHSLTICILGSK